MRILHGCLAAFYIDNAGYQENFLPKAHARQGHDVRIVASTESYVDGRKLGYVAARRYVNEHGIRVSRLPYSRWLPHAVAKKLRMYEGLMSELKEFKPDVIFLHDLQFLDARLIARYSRENPHVRVFVDGHTDSINSARGWISSRILHGIIYKWCARQLIPVVEQFWGVTPVRADFMNEMYGVPREKLGVLVMGYDETSVDLARREEIRQRVRGELGWSQNDFVVVSGGRLEPRKEISSLLRAARDARLAKIRIAVVGEAVPSYVDEFRALADAPNVSALGWLTPARISEVFLAADLGCFPGSHSVLWEQAVGVGLPAIFRRIPGFEHVDLGGNCILIDDSAPAILAETIAKVANRPSEFAALRDRARATGPAQFSYDSVARRAIGGTASR